MAGERRNALEVKWRIANFKTWFEMRNDTLYSPQCLAETLMHTRWKLSLSPNWQLAEKYITLTFQRDIDDQSELINLNYELSFLACDGSPLKSKTYSKKFAPKTVSHELSVKEVEILKEMKAANDLEGVLTVCCKFWCAASTIAKAQQCVMGSVIGTKKIDLTATIHPARRPSYTTVNFMPPSTDISLITLDVYESDEALIFQRKHVECKSFRWYSCKLFTNNLGGPKIQFSESIDIKKSLILNSTSNLQFALSDAAYCSRSLLLEIKYYPGVISESIKSEFNICEKIFCGAADLVNLNSSNSSADLVCTSDSCDIPKDVSSDEDECFDTVGYGHLPSTTLKNDLTSLYNDRLFCDTKLRTGTETFPAHRNVLSARSPVFKKMFTTDMKEAAGEYIDVPDIDSNTVRRMLQFLYTDCTGDLEMQSAKDLYAVSEKYDIASLKQQCSSFMKKNLCPANVCEVLVLADVYQDKDLESAANEYVFNYDEEVFGSDEWKLFMQNCSALAARVMYLKLRKNK